MRKLKLFTDLSLLEKKWLIVDLLIPFMGQDKDERNPDFNLRIGRFDIYENTGKEGIELTSLEEADACLLPVHYPQTGDINAFEKDIQPFLHTIKGSGKKTLVFVGSEIDHFQVNIEDAIIFHSSLYQSKRNSNEFSLPFFFEDFIQKYYNGVLPIRKKPQNPTIGFCGYAPPLGQPWGKLKLKESLRLFANYLGLIKQRPSFSAHSYRARALTGILKSRKVDQNFIIREQFAFGGPYGALSPGRTKELNKLFREAYVKNIIESDYTLCVRGIGNNSFRLYEALCCGRIPVFVNTNCVMPYDFEIDWKKYCVVIEEKDIDKIAEKLQEFHQALTEEEFIQMQHNARKLWVDYFTPQGFFKNIYKHLDQHHLATNKEQMRH